MECEPGGTLLFVLPICGWSVNGRLEFLSDPPQARILTTIKGTSSVLLHTRGSVQYTVPT